MTKNSLTAERLREVLAYEQDTGTFTWKATRRNGLVAGSSDNHGYLLICVDGTKHKAHRLAWLYVHGRWPDAQIDHINGKRGDNQICNLREATQAQNSQNLYFGGKSVGACWHKLRNKWISRIRVNGRLHHIGYFTTQQEAHEAYLSAKVEKHKFQPTPRAIGG